MAHSTDRGSIVLLAQTMAASLHRREAGTVAVHNWACLRLEVVKDRLLGADPQEVPRLQGEAKAYRELLKSLGDSK